MSTQSNNAPLAENQPEEGSWTCCGQPIKNWPNHSGDFLFDTKIRITMWRLHCRKGNTCQHELCGKEGC